MEEYTFQIVDILSDDISLPVKSKGANKLEKRFILSIYGITEKKERIICHILRYIPYFFIKIPLDWIDSSKGEKLIKAICKSNGKSNLLTSIKSYERKTYNDFYGFYWDKENNKQQSFNFLKINFTNYTDMKKVIYEVRNFYNNDYDTHPEFRDWWDKVITNQNCDSNLYESKLHPILRFIHDTGIDPTGWVTCKPSSKCNFGTGLFEEVNYEISCSYKDITKYESTITSPYTIASFDIECDSSHGDFPLPKKDFKKLAIGIFDSYRNMYLKGSVIIKDDMKTNISEYIGNLIEFGFGKPLTECKSIYKYTDIHLVYTFKNQRPTPESIQYVITEICDDMSITDSLCIQKVISKERDKCINTINDLCNSSFKNNSNYSIRVIGDPIIQIGTVFHNYGDTKPCKRHILVIGPQDNMESNDICDSLDSYDIEVDTCINEKELLLKWSELIKEEDPDFITGYNIFGFDFKYIKDRVDVHFNCHHRCNKWGHHSSCEQRRFYNLGKMESSDQNKEHKSKICKYSEQKLASSALGDNELSYITMDGRILFDIQKEVQKGHNLESYKLDNVASHFMRGKIKDINQQDILVDTVGHLKDGDFISFRMHSNIGEELYQDGDKIKIKTIDGKRIYLEETLNLNLEKYHKIEWCLTKDDITPQDIFDKHKQIEGGSKARAEIAKYCIQDCELCINLLLLLDIIPNNLAMADVSFVPASYIFLRGQGVKVTSVVTKECSKRNTRIPELIKIPNLKDYVKMAKNGSTVTDIEDKIIEDADWRKPSSWELKKWLEEINKKDDYKIRGYEGAIVLDPTPGIYLDDPITVLDYASLYPSSIIEKNISHETFIEGGQSFIDKMGWILDKDYHEIEYDNWIYKGKGKGDSVEKLLDKDNPKIKCYFLTKDFMKRNNMVENPVGEPKGIIPAVLDHLLSARTETKKRMKKEPDEFKKKVLDGLQLAYKVTANSVYGQLGARTSTIFKLELAACTTSVGRERLTIDATNGVEDWAKSGGYQKPTVVYGDTDSVFVKFSRINKEGILLEGKEALAHSIKCGQEAGEFIKNLMNKEGKQPQVLEYEKTFWPFILISKKRYTGDKYEFEPNNAKRTSMGIVLKRRDNANIVKYVFGHVIEKIMIDKDFGATVIWLKKTLEEIRTGKFPISYFVISKSLRGYYKNPQGIAHKVLADRMAERDPGNKPKSNDRIPYVYQIVDDKPIITGYKMKNVKKENGKYKNGKIKYKQIREPDENNPKYKKKNILQGDRIEHIDFMIKNKLKIDYEFYITNQIMNPVKQVLDLEMDPKETEKLFLKV